MVSALTFIVILSIGLAHATPVTRELCNAQVHDSPDSCDSIINIPKSCNSATLSLKGTHFTSCTEVNLFWNYPKNNLTVIIETPFTKQRQPYAVNFDNNFGFGIPLYRIVDGKETKIKSTDNVIAEKSDSNYQVILKINARPTLSVFEWSFNYKVTQSNGNRFIY